MTAAACLFIFFSDFILFLLMLQTNMASNEWSLIVEAIVWRSAC
jgi:hypothetical protein